MNKSEKAVKHELRERLVCERPPRTRCLYSIERKLLPRCSKHAAAQNAYSLLKLKDRLWTRYERLATYNSLAGRTKRPVHDCDRAFRWPRSSFTKPR